MQTNQCISASLVNAAFMFLFVFLAFIKSKEVQIKGSSISDIEAKAFNTFIDLLEESA